MSDRATRRPPVTDQVTEGGGPSAAQNPKPPKPPTADRTVPSRPKIPWESGEKHARQWLPNLVALLVAFAGAVNVGSSLTPALKDRLSDLAPIVPRAITGAATAGTVVTGLLLLMLARGLRRRKRRAWQATVLVLAISVVLHVVKGLDIEEALLALGVLLTLVVTRTEFQAKGDPRTRWRALGVGLLLFLTSTVLGMVLIRLYHARIVDVSSTTHQLSYVLQGLIGVRGHLEFLRGHHGSQRVIGDVLAAMGLMTAVTTLYLALRPSEPTAQLLPEDEERMRELLAKHGGRDSLSYFALRRDKSVVWSPTGKSAIAYRVLSGVLLASGDPLGDPEAWPGAIAAMLQLAGEHAWVPAVMGCSEQAAIVYCRHGLTALELGDEAIVEVADFTLEGRAMRGVRQAVNRVERAGYETQVRRVSDISQEEQFLLRSQADTWRGAETERGFSMALGRFGDPSDPDCVAVTTTQDGVLRGFLHFVPWGPDGLSLDLMRRDRDSDNGVNELLISKALQDAPQLGVTKMSLNFAVFRAALERGERVGAGPISRGWRGLLVFVSRWFQIDSLYRFNAKFRPIWEPRFVCYPGATDLPRVALAALEAEAFLVWPTSALRRRLRGKPHHSDAVSFTAGP